MNAIPRPSTLSITFSQAVAEVRLNRPDVANALNEDMWRELRESMQWADTTPEVRVVVITGAGRHFCSGIDLSMLQRVEGHQGSVDAARVRELHRRRILYLQDCLASIEQCRKPVLAAINGACIGAGVDLITWCDMRYATTDTFFSVREIDIGMTADVGTLQRLPRLIADGIARELVFTGRNVDAAEAQLIGLVNRVFASTNALRAGVMEIAQSIAAKSPLAIRGTKEMLNYARDHSVADGLNYIATWNAAMLPSVDRVESMLAIKEKRPPVFED
jgi:enoyl-CoA hydratase